jgi:hypothetical protein
MWHRCLTVAAAAFRSNPALMSPVAKREREFTNDSGAGMFSTEYNGNSVVKRSFAVPHALGALQPSFSSTYFRY